MRHPVVTEDLRGLAGLGLPFRRLAGSTVLITGAGGFLPAYMAETLLFLNEARKLGVTVVGLVRNGAKARRRFAHYRGRRDLRLVVADAAGPLPARLAPDYIIHAASQASPRYYRRDPVGTLAPNILGTWRLLELARARKSAGFLYFSSSEVYGEVPAAWGRIREDRWGPVDPLAVRSCYSESKRAGESLCAAWHRQYGVPFRVVRPFHTYGPGMPLHDGRVFSDFVGDIVRGRDIVLKGDGRVVRSFCYLADAAAAFFTVLLRGAEGEAYNVGHDRAALSVSDFARFLVRTFPERRLRVLRRPSGCPPPGGAPSRICPDLSRLRGLGWRPRYTLKEGLRRTLAYNL
ncbi:MAG: NAD-dependent epimerase/dehydratase family protein [Elusimicrobia bacterium]|nr:NAD-dependent epimerase/dehydratase family protein [Elusimicrobiota bacterium]